MTTQQQERLEHLLRIIRESAEKIIDDTSINDQQLLFLLYKQGFNFLHDQRDQSLVDIGSIGLAFAVRRAAHNGSD